MPKFQVIRMFPSNPAIRHGQIIEDPAWRNLDLLIRTGYLREISDKKVADLTELPRVEPEEISAIEVVSKKKAVKPQEKKNVSNK